jgi:hypothetical protein
MFTNVSGQRIGPIFKGQESEKNVLTCTRTLIYLFEISVWSVVINLIKVPICLYDVCLDTGSITADVFIEMVYEQRCQSEVIRQTKGSKVLGMAVNPVCERRIGVWFFCYVNSHYISGNYHITAVICDL